ncbi:hypothetical protein [Herbidospora sp. RD11066]
MEKALARAVELLVSAAEGIAPSPGRRAWNYGWHVESYRRSGKAAISLADEVFSLSAEGLIKYEELMSALTGQVRIRERWDSEEIWGVVASLIAHVSNAENAEALAGSSLERLLYSKPSLVVFPVANVQWKGPPIRIAKKLAIGILGEEFANVVGGMGGRTGSSIEELIDYMGTQKHRPPIVGFAALVPGQRSLAFTQAEQKFHLLVDLSLLLEADKEKHGLFSVRGASNRPGVRGLTLDRTVIGEAFKISNDTVDLACQPFIQDELGVSRAHRWYSPERVPLEDLLADDLLRSSIEKCLASESNISRRIQVAARWFSESFWSESTDDSALAAGVALDALLGAKSALPGRAMKERFALLDPDPDKRADRARKHEEIYAVRSIVAHGGESRKLEEGDFVREMQDAVTWTAKRLLEAESIFSIASDKSLETMFEDLRWGTRSW